MVLAPPGKGAPARALVAGMSPMTETIPTWRFRQVAGKSQCPAFRELFDRAA
jgi:hypothetical protein